MQPDRIGHGTFIGLGSSIAKPLPPSVAGITPFELCLTSNLKTKTVPSLAEHHIVTLHAQRQPFCICTDDSGVFATTLSLEYMAASEALRSTKLELWDIAHAAIGHSFAPDALKDALRNEMLVGKAELCMPRSRGAVGGDNAKL